MKLEEMSLWYQYKTKVWLNEYDPITAVVHNTMRVLRSIRGNFNYLSTPITSGKTAFDNPSFSMGKIINLNTVNGYVFANSLNVPNLIVPCELCPTHHHKWEQDHFQALWLSIIAEKCENVYMNKDWEYSNGCAEELVHSFQLRLGIPTHDTLVFYNTKEDREESIERMKKIQVYDHNKKLISIDQAIYKLEASAKLIGSAKLNRSKEMLIKVKELINEITKIFI